jgi:hypothetical protein
VRFRMMVEATYANKACMKSFTYVNNHKHGSGIKILFVGHIVYNSRNYAQECTTKLCNY